MAQNHSKYQRPAGSFEASPQPLALGRLPSVTLCQHLRGPRSLLRTISLLLCPSGLLTPYAVRASRPAAHLPPGSTAQMLPLPSGKASWPQAELRGTCSCRTLHGMALLTLAPAPAGGRAVTAHSSCFTHTSVPEKHRHCITLLSFIPVSTNATGKTENSHVPPLESTFPHFSVFTSQLC